MDNHGIQIQEIPSRVKIGFSSYFMCGLGRNQHPTVGMLSISPETLAEIEPVH